VQFEVEGEREERAVGREGIGGGEERGKRGEDGAVELNRDAFAHIFTCLTERESERVCVCVCVCLCVCERERERETYTHSVGGRRIRGCIYIHMYT
jgi:hypothetical protein